jgi:Mg/Co/Ni transporter MgtE
LPLQLSVGEALAFMREHPPGSASSTSTSSTSATLRGVVPTRRLLMSPPETRLADVIVPDVVTLGAESTMEDAAALFLSTSCWRCRSWTPAGCWPVR